MSAYKQERQWRMPPKDARCIHGAPYYTRPMRPIVAFINSINEWLSDCITIGDTTLYVEVKPVQQLPAPVEARETCPTPALPADNALNDMSGWPYNWNGRGFEAPRAAAITNARMHVGTFRNVAKLATLPWCEPHVTSSPEGEIVFEWWRGEKKLTIYFQDDSAEFVKVWGPNVHSEMEDGKLSNFLPLLDWLTT